jgi:site-specific DNA recombinase
VRLEANLTEMTTSVNSPVNLEKMLDRAVNALSNIDLVYTRSDTNQKREIIGSMYPEKLVFSESGYQTTKINEAVALIFQINSDLREEKSGTFSDFSQKSRFVPGTGIEPVRALQLTGF